MAESHSIVKIAIFVGMAFVLIAAFNPSAGAAWTNFQNSIQGFPQFNNPFDSATKVSDFTLIPSKPLHGAFIPAEESDLLTGCSFSWSCIRDFNSTDGNKSYVTLRPYVIGGKNLVTADLAGTPTGQKLIGGSFDFWCRGNGADVTASASLRKWNGTGYRGVFGSYGQWTVCPNGFFGHTSYAFEWTGAHGEDNGATGGDYPFTVSIEIASTNTANASFTTARVRLSMTSAPTGCVSGDFFTNLGCQIGQFFGLVVNVATFFVNAIVFIGQVLIYFINIIAQFIGLFGYFFSVPGMPVILQSVLTVLFIGLILFVILVIMGKVRGTGNTG